MPSGAIALFWHVPLDPQTEWSRAIDDLFQQYAPQFENPHHAFTLAWLEEIIRGNFRDYGGLGTVRVKTYNWAEMMDADTFTKLLRTYSGLRDLDDEMRYTLHAGIFDVIQYYGGRIAKPYQMVLFHTRVG